jgi:hypothetical protein
MQSWQIPGLKNVLAASSAFDNTPLAHGPVKTSER